MATSATACTYVYVSWDGSGAFTGPYDNVTADVLGDPGVSVDIGKDGARQLSPPKVSACDFALKNWDRTYSQEWAGSPVYQHILPGRPVRVTMLHGATDAYDAPTPYSEADYYDGAAAYWIARGAIDDIAQTTALGQQTVTLRTLGIETLLVSTTVSVGLMTNPRVDECITAILDAVGWPSAQRSIAVADTQLTYWWCDDRTPWDAMLELLASEGPGALYVTAENNGTIYFENRNYRVITDRSVTPQAAFFDRRGSGLSAYDEPTPYTEADAYDGEVDTLYFTSLSYEPGFKSIQNAARYPTKRRVLATSPAPIWQYGADLQPAATGTTLIIHPTDPFSGAVVPVLGTDYTVSGGTVSFSLSAPSGLVAFLTVTATSGVPTVSGPTASPTTGLQLRAYPLTVVGETTMTNVVDASTSIAKYSPIPGANIPHVLDIAGWPEILPTAAQAVCDAWVRRYMEPRASVSIELRNVNSTHMREILRLAISDRITLYERNTGLAADCWINTKQLTITSLGGSDVRATLGCEKIDEVRGGVWDLSWWDDGSGATGRPAAIWGV